jgi:O-antigen ligase
MRLPSVPSSKTFEKITSVGLFLFAAGLSISHVPLQFGAVICLIGILGQHWTSKSFVFEGSRLFAVWGFYLVWNIASAALSARPLHSLGAVADNEWPVLIMFMLYWGVRDVAHLDRILKTTFIASTVAFVYSLIQLFAGKEFYRGSALMPVDEHVFRAVGFYGGSLAFAAYAMVMFFLSAAAMYGKKGKEILRWSPIPILAGFGLLATFARSVWLSLFGILPFMGFGKDKRTGWRFLGICLVVWTVALIAVPQIRDRVSTIFTVREETRINLWKTSIRIIEAYPIMGVGQDNFDYHFPIYRVEGFYDAFGHPHSDYFNVLVNGGIPAGIAFLLLWVLVIRKGWNVIQRKTDPLLHNTAVGATFGLVGLLIGASFQNYYGTFVNCWLWWFVVGLIMVADRLSREQSQTIS